MASITLNHLEDSLSNQLILLAAAHGRTVEDEVVQILKSSLASQPSGQPPRIGAGMGTGPSKGLGKGLGSRIHSRFAALGGIELPPPDRDERAFELFGVPLINPWTA